MPCTDLHITGSGIGSWTKEEIGLLFKEILPEVFELAAAGKIKADVNTVPLKDIEKIWAMDVENGKRLIVTID